jgi:hypothetical protein
VKDQDGDGVEDGKDNCPWAYNPDQKNSDKGEGGEDCDPYGDACDLQSTSSDCLSPCGPACTYDADGDGVPGGWVWPGQEGCPYPTGGDNCPFAKNADQKDTDKDGIGDACDNCPEVPNPSQWDGNGNGVGDSCEVKEEAGLGSGSGREALRIAALRSFVTRGIVSARAFRILSDGAHVHT